jgi:ubiquinone/menaquinone biosynthesis C-methylase UbiE
VKTDFVEVRCPVCDSEKYRVVYESTLGSSLPDLGYKFAPSHLKTYRIVRCLHCGHRYCSPLPRQLFKGYIDVEDSEYLRNEPQRLATAEKVMGVLRKYKNGGRLLDVGCATGDFLRVAARYYDVEGLELSTWAARLAKERGLWIHESRLEELGATERYDVVTLWGVIEHFENPRKEIGQVARLMKRGGVLCIWTGDIESLTARLLGKKWWYFMGQHIQYFSRATLHRLLEECGFTKVAIRNYPYVLSMSSVANSIGRYPLVSRLFAGIFKSPGFSSAKITFALPGEMFAIYAKGALSPHRDE